MQVTETEFRNYESIRESGVTNMFDLKTVMRLTGLSRDKIVEIMDNYRELYEKYTEA